MAAAKRNLDELVRSAGFTPGAKDVPPLLELLADDDDDIVRDVERALVRVGPTVVPVAIARAGEVGAPLRGRIVRVIGKLVESPAALAYLIDALRNDDAKTRRNAALALGRATIQKDLVEEALLAAWRDEPRVDHRRSIAQSLGKIGGPASIEALRALETDDTELRRIATQALMQLERSALREEATTIDASVSPSAPRAVVFRSRSGIERILERELGPSWSPRVPSKGVVEATLKGALGSIFDARTWVRMAFPLAPRAVNAGDLATAVIDALTSDDALDVMRTFTRGTIRYRLAWESRGPSRALVWRVAEGVSARKPELVNDPTQSTWEASIFEGKGHEENGHVRVELTPRALVDPRFTYRTGDVPAASHPTLAAALVRVAGVRPNDVVWDPFVGSGSELVERAKHGAFASLHGSDTEPRALDVARANLLAAGLTADLALGDATSHVVPGVSLILTNPPMGRRVARGELATLLDRFIDHAAKVLAVGGRLVWLSPLPDRTRERLNAAGLKRGFRQIVDMGGFDAELQSAAKVG